MNDSDIVPAYTASHRSMGGLVNARNAMNYILNVINLRWQVLGISFWVLAKEPYGRAIYKIPERSVSLANP